MVIPFSFDVLPAVVEVHSSPNENSVHLHIAKLNFCVVRSNYVVNDVDVKLVLVNDVLDGDSLYVAQ